MISVLKKRMAKTQREVFNVFDEEFSSFIEALAFACALYKIKKSRLSQLYFDSDESFDRAIGFFMGWLRTISDPRLAEVYTPEARVIGSGSLKPSLRGHYWTWQYYSLHTIPVSYFCLVQALGKDCVV